MKKIACVLETFPNLSETFIIDQMIYVASQGHKVCLYYDHLNAHHSHILQKLAFHHIELKDRWIAASLLKKIIQHVPYRFKYLFVRLFDVLSDVRLNQHDVILAHFGQNGLRLAYSKKYNVLKKPFVTFFHGYDVGGFLKDGKLDHYKELIKFGNFFLPVSQYFQNLLINSGASSQKTHIFHMGVASDGITFKDPALTGKIKFLSVCRLVEKKGILYAIEALHSIHQSHPHLDWHYDIGGDGPLLNDLKQHVKSYGLEAKISFLGAMQHDAVKSKMADSDIFLLPSITAPSGDVEGIPVVLMEAMASGLVACSTYHSGIPELIEHQKTGLLAAEKNVEQLAKNILWAIENPNECKIMAKNARTYIEKNFNNEILYRQLLNYL